MRYEVNIKKTIVNDEVQSEVHGVTETKIIVPYRGRMVISILESCIAEFDFTGAGEFWPSTDNDLIGEWINEYMESLYSDDEQQMVLVLLELAKKFIENEHHQKTISDIIDNFWTPTNAI